MQSDDPSRGNERGFGELSLQEVEAMVPVLLVLLLVLILFGAGFAVKVLWWIALIVLVVWLLGFLMRGTTRSGGRSRWYRW